MAAYRYWRIMFIGSGGGSYAGVNKLTFHSANGTSLATGGTPFASSNAGTLYGPERAFDESDLSSWLSAANSLPAYLGYDFGVDVDVAYIYVLSHSGYLGNDLIVKPGQARVEVSSNGTTWVTHPNAIAPSLLDNYSFRLTITSVLASEVEVRDTFQSFGSVTSQRYPTGFQLPAVLQGMTEFSYPPLLPLFGLGSISGTLKVLAAPAKRLVRLFDRGSGQKVRETMSGLDGTYRFDHLDLGRTYFVVGFDDPLHYDPTYNAAVVDQLRAGVTTP